MVFLCSPKRLVVFIFNPDSNTGSDGISIQNPTDSNPDSNTGSEIDSKTDPNTVSNTDAYTDSTRVQ